MSAALLSGSSYRLGSRQILLPLLYPSNQILRAASLNSAIGRGLRKSKGVGFRGKERYNNFGDGGNNRADSASASLIRRTADPPIQSSLTREGARKPFRHERRAEARANDPGELGMRLRKGKRVLKDPRAPPPRRSRAARFNDPSSSFGKRSKPVEERRPSKNDQDEEYDPDIEEVRESRRLGADTGDTVGGRKRPNIMNARHRAAESDRMALERNPDGSKLSKSRLLYLEKTKNGSQAPEERIPRPPREPYVFARDDRDGRQSREDSREINKPVREVRDSGHNLRESYRSTRSDPEQRNNGRESYQPALEERESRFGTKESYQAAREERNAHPKKPIGLKLDSATSSVRPTFTQTQDNRYPLQINYTTPASEFLYGTSVVEAALLSRRNPRRKLYKLYIYTGENRENAERDAAMEKLARKQKIEIVRVDTNGIRLLDKMSAGRPHNGYVLESSPLPRLPITALGELTGVGDREGFMVALDYQSREDASINGTENFIPTIRNGSGRKPLVLLLDSIIDPGNLGGIIRTASFLGVTAIAISTKNSASFTPVVLKASAGASENVTLFSVSKPAGFIEESKLNGWKVYAAVAPTTKGALNLPSSITTDELDNPLLNDPCILMLGNEGEGLRWNLRSKANIELAIKGSSNTGGVDSLNVSVATGILCTSFLRRQYNAPHRAKKSEENKRVEDTSTVVEKIW
jgi:21S rRNA (GM2251-2'-O)-methyltransferase